MPFDFQVPIDVVGSGEEKTSEIILESKILKLQLG